MGFLFSVLPVSSVDCTPNPSATNLISLLGCVLWPIESELFERSIALIRLPLLAWHIIFLQPASNNTCGADHIGVYHSGRKHYKYAGATGR